VGPDKDKGDAMKLKIETVAKSLLSTVSSQGEALASTRDLRDQECRWAKNGLFQRAQIIVIAFLCILCALACFSVAYTQEDMGFEPDSLPKPAADYKIAHELFDAAWEPIKGPFDGVAAIRLSRPDAATDKEIYTLVLYIDRIRVTRKEGIALPHYFKWNFKGLNGGNHEMFFALKDTQGKVGIAAFVVTIAHDE
jgi:hypothetical protein